MCLHEQTFGEAVDIGMGRPQVGDVIGPAIYVPTLTRLVMYAAAMWEFQRIHFDPDWARSEGLDAPIVHGPLLGTYLAQTVRAWAGDARVRSIGWRNENVAQVDEQLEVAGEVVRVDDVDGAAWSATCNLSIHTVDGPRVLSGRATVCGERGGA